MGVVIWIYGRSDLCLVRLRSTMAADFTPVYVLNFHWLCCFMYLLCYRLPAWFCNYHGSSSVSQLQLSGRGLTDHGAKPYRTLYVTHVNPVVFPGYIWISWPLTVDSRNVKDQIDFNHAPMSDLITECVFSGPRLLVKASMDLFYLTVIWWDKLNGSIKDMYANTKPETFKWSANAVSCVFICKSFAIESIFLLLSINISAKYIGWEHF